MIRTRILKLVFYLMTSIDFGLGQLYNKSIDWNRRVDGLYLESMAKADFGSVTGWRSDRVMIVNGTLRLTLLKDAVGEASGLVASTKLPVGSAYHLDYDVLFDREFDWNQGGKLGFGNAGCEVPTTGEGGSLRLVWLNKKKEVYFIPYIYNYGMPGPCGSNFGLRYPATGSTLQKGKWYRIHLYIQSNNGNNTDGHVRILIDNTTLIDQNIRWTINDSKRWVNIMFFSTFRGGGGTYWQSNIDSYIYSDNSTDT